MLESADSFAVDSGLEIAVQFVAVHCEIAPVPVAEGPVINRGHLFLVPLFVDLESVDCLHPQSHLMFD